jgi:hypothetical protein
MKKIYIFFVIILLCLGTAGCQQNHIDENADNIKLLMPFDTYEQVQSFRTYANLFGKAEINTNKMFIKEGKGSLHVLPTGDYGSVNAYPFIFIRCESDFFATNDFSKFEYIAFDVYNDNDIALTLKVHMCIYGDLKVVDTPVKTYTLKPKAWSKIIYDLSDGSIRKTFGKLDSVKGIYIQFPEYKRTKEGTVNSLYLDNLVGKKSEEIQVYSARREIDELVYFENPSDINLFNTRSNEFDVIYNPDLSINMDSVYVSQGKMSMKCEYKYIYIQYQTFTRSMNPWVPVSINLSAYKYLSQNATGISIDIYNPNDTERTIIVFHTSKDNTVEEKHTIGINQWKTIEVQADDISDWVEFGIKTNYEKENKDYVFYIDNIKFLR